MQRSPPVIGMRIGNCFSSTLDALDREIDAYDDALEAQYARGELTFEEFRKLDRQAEDLEDKLDAAEDRLESRFGMDD